MQGILNKKSTLSMLMLVVLIFAYFLSAGAPAYAAGTVYSVSTTAITSGTDINWADLPTCFINGPIADGDTIEFLDVPSAVAIVSIEKDNITLDGTALGGTAIPIGLGVPDNFNLTLKNININSQHYNGIICFTAFTLLAEGNVSITSQETALISTAGITIGGNGNLTLTSQNGPGISADTSTVTLKDNLSLTISPNAVNAGFNGINCKNLVMEDNSNLTTSGSTSLSGTGGAGIYASNTITHNSTGLLFATGGNGADGGNGISCNNLLTTGTGDITSLGSASGSAGSGIYASGTIEHNGSGMLHALGGYPVNCNNPVVVNGTGEVKLSAVSGPAPLTLFSTINPGEWKVSPHTHLIPATLVTDSQIAVVIPTNMETIVSHVTYTADVSAQSGTLTEGTEGSAAYQLTTENIPAASAITLNNINSVGGIVLNTTATVGDTTVVTIETSAATPAGSHPLTLEIAGVTTDIFYLNVLPVGTVVPPAPQPPSSGSGSYSYDNNDYDFSNLRPSTPVATVQAKQPKIITIDEMNAAIKYAYTYAQGATTATADLWKLFAGTGRGYRHDTFENCKVQVRVQFENPEKLTADIELAGYVSGSRVQSIKNQFAKYFCNSINVVVLDQQENWGQQAHIAANITFSGSTQNLYFYSYNAQTNSYKTIPNPNYYIDGNGYLRFNTDYAGSIIISDGPLQAR